MGIKENNPLELRSIPSFESVQTCTTWGGSSVAICTVPHPTDEVTLPMWPSLRDIQCRSISDDQFVWSRVKSSVFIKLFKSYFKFMSQVMLSSEDWILPVPDGQDGWRLRDRRKLVIIFEIRIVITTLPCTVPSLTYLCPSTANLEVILWMMQSYSRSRTSGF